MPIEATDIKYYYSGGSSNSDPDLSLGGAISAFQPTNATTNNLFDYINGTEANDGDTEYRCFYVKNTHATLTLTAVKVFISTNTPSTDTTCNIAIGTSGLNGTEQTIANENTAPIGTSFSAPSTYDTGLDLPDLAPGEYHSVWLERILSASAAAYTGDSVSVRVAGFSTL